MLRDYQSKAINQIRDAFDKIARKVILWLATGGGKTVIFCEILKKLSVLKVKAILIVRRRKLVDQASKRLIREGVPHGVIMANHWNRRGYEGIQICSIDTLISQKFHPETEACKTLCSGKHLEAEMIIVDECHDATSDAYRDFLEQYQEALILSVTASPWPNKSLAHLADAIVHPISIQELINQGYLVPPRYFCPGAPDLKDVKIQGGEYNQVQLAAAMDKNELIGDVVEHYIKIGEKRKFLCFAVNVLHSQHIAARFREAGLNVVHCDADTPDIERDNIIERLEHGDIDGITNVNIFATGVDIPMLPCIIMARATQSYNLYIQQAGRGTRPMYAPGMPLDTAEQRLAAIAAGPKQNFILLDHAGNVYRHLFITDEREPHIGKDAIKIGMDKFAVSQPITTCWKCFAGYRGDACPNGCPPPVVEIDKENEGQLEEITSMEPEQLYIQKLKFTQKNKGYKQGWLYYRFLEKFGEEKAKIYFPPKKVPDFIRERLERRKLADAATQFLKEAGYAQG